MGENHHEKLGLERISCAGQFAIPDMADTSPDPACNYSDSRTSQSNHADRTPDSSYPLISTTSFSSSSRISLCHVHKSTIIAEQNVKSSLSISPCHDDELTPSTEYTERTAYTNYIISEVQHSPKIVRLPFILMIRS